MDSGESDQAKKCPLCHDVWFYCKCWYDKEEREKFEKLAASESQEPDTQSGE